MVRPVDRLNSDQIELDVPLHARHSLIVRALAAAVAADAGFNVDEIDDFRLGVNEAVALLTDTDAGTAARMHLTFHVDGSSVKVVASRRGVDSEITVADVDELARRILTAVLDDFHIEDGSFVVVKRATPARA